MSENSAAPSGPVYRPISGTAESLAAIDDVISVAERTIRIFDIALANRGFNAPARAEKLRAFLVRGRAHRLQIALHETDGLGASAQGCSRCCASSPCRSRSTARSPRRAPPDPFVLADDHSVWHQLHFEQPRASWRFPRRYVPIAQLFEIKGCRARHLRDHAQALT